MSSSTEVNTAELLAAMDAGSADAVAAALMDIVAEASATASPRTIARARARLDRLRSKALNDHKAQLDRAVASLGHALTRLNVVATSERNTREGGELARELLDLLESPTRPKSLIESTGADPAQVARTLRRLEQSGDIERTPSPAADGRERWFRRCQPATAANPATTERAPSQPVTVTHLRHRLRNIAPIRELRLRKFIADTADPHQQALDVAKLYRVGNIFEEPSFALAARRSQRDKSISSSQIAWIACVRHKGELSSIAPFERDRLCQLAAELPRRLQTGTEDVRLLSHWLAECGVALVIEPGFSGAKLDGVAVGGANGQKIVGLSLRLDRFDSLVFTLLHELAHIINGDIDSAGEVCVDEALGETVETSERERAANSLASTFLFPNGLNIPSKPTAQWVTATARDAGVHPSLVIGHVQHSLENWTFLKGNVPKVRHLLETATT